MENGKTINIIFVVIMTVLAVFLLFQAGRFVFGGIFGSSDEPKQTASEEIIETKSEIEDYIEDGSTATLTYTGRTIANEDHRIIEVVITPSSRTLRVKHGYEGKIESTQTYSNNQSSYADFMHAVAIQGILEKKDGLYEDPVGVCSTGKRQEFHINGKGLDDHYVWATTCSKKDGTLAGDRSDIASLFKKQIPDYSKLTRNINL